MDKIEQLIATLASGAASERNKAAIALMDLGDSRAVEPLVATINNPKNRLARGTLIYALSAFDCSSLFVPLFRWATEGGYEVAAETTSILKEQQMEPSPDERAVCQDLLDQYVKQGASTDYKDFVLDCLAAILNKSGDHP